jgi:hypothetical protein
LIFQVLTQESGPTTCIDISESIQFLYNQGKVGSGWLFFRLLLSLSWTLSYCFIDVACGHYHIVILILRVQWCFVTIANEKTPALIENAGGKITINHKSKNKTNQKTE